MNYDRVILEMLDRIKKLELAVEKIENYGCISKSNNFLEKTEFNLKNIEAGLFGRDKTKYIFEGVKYSKRRLVLAIVMKYVDFNPNVTIKELQNIFDSSLQGSFGVVVEKNMAIKIKDFEKRFFSKKEEEIKMVDGICLVCSQWTLRGIIAFIARARQLNFDIIEIK